MPRAQRLWGYLLREVTPLYAVGIVTLLVLLIIDFFASLAGVFLRSRPPIALVGQLLLDRLPFLLSYSLAPALAFAILIGLGRLAKDSELKAAYALGVRPAGLLAPLLALGVLVGGLSFLNANWWQPIADARFLDDYYRVFNGQPAPRFQETQSFASRDGRLLFHAGAMTPDPTDDRKARLSGVMVLEADPARPGQNAVHTALSGEWDSAARTWELYSASTVRGAGGSTPVRTDRLSFPFEYDLPPFKLPPEHLGLDELRRRAASPSIGPDERYAAHFALQRRLADPMAALAMALVGGAMGLTVANRAWAFAGVIGLIFGYWILWTLGQDLAAGQSVNFAVAAWLPVAIFSAGGLAALRRLA